jgi:tetratricopeptide (TPR) repeat protein
LLDKAEVYHGRKRLPEALETLELALSRLGEFTSVVYLKAAADFLSRGSFDRAFPLLQRANRLHPANRDVAWQYAEMCIKYSDQFLKRRKYRDACGYAYEAVKAVEGVPNAERDHARDLAACLYREACILSAFASAEEVEEILVRCVRLDPDKVLYADELERLRGPRRRSLFSPRGGASPKGGKVGRNDPCPCGSGAKYKNCCLDKQR